MASVRRFLFRLWNFLRPERAEREIARELAAHISLLEDEFQRQGMTPENARLAAKRASGGVDQTKELHREARSFIWLEDWRRDVRYAIRGMARNPGFAATAILTLALGMAGTTVVFALVDGVILRPLPVFQQDRLVVVWKELRASRYTHYPFGDVEIEAVGEASQLLEKVAGVTRNGVSDWVINENGRSDYVSGALVAGDFFGVLGVEPLLGRAISQVDDVDGAGNVVVISHGLWQRRYGGSPQVIGRQVRLTDQLFTIVGVMPPGLDYPNGVEIWRSTRSVPIDSPFGEAARREVDLIGRLRPGVTRQQAASELNGLIRQFEVEQGGPRDLMAVVHAFEDVVVGEMRLPVMALFSAVGLVLFIACANVANLMMMRGESRRQEFAIRQALGSARGRIVRQLFSESMVLAAIAGIIALVVAYWCLPSLLRFVPDRLPRAAEVRVDLTVILFTVIIAGLTAFLAGLAPALSSMRRNFTPTMRSDKSGVGASAKQGRRVLVVAQVALAVTIVAAAGLLGRTLLKLQAVNLGLQADQLVLVDLALPPAIYAESASRERFFDEAISRLEAIPVIAAATPVNVPPFAGAGGWDLPRFTAEGQSADRAVLNPSLNLESVHPNYFETLKVPMIKGRAFTAADRPGALDVAIVSEDVAERTWPGADPIGKRLKMGSSNSPDRWRTVVGVAAPTRYRDLTSPQPTLYLPAPQFLMTAKMLMLRTTSPVDLVASLARDQVRAVDADVQVMRVASFAQLLDGPLAQARFNALLLSVFAGAALLLSTIGLYAVVAAHVGQRNREIAIRIALGATAANVRRLVINEAVGLAALGGGIGIIGAGVGTHLVRGMLFGVTPLDPPTFALVFVAFAVVTMLAAYVPIRRATNVDPFVVLRCE